MSYGEEIKGVGEGGREFGAVCSNKCECIYEQVCIKAVFLLGSVCVYSCL